MTMQRRSLILSMPALALALAPCLARAEDALRWGYNAAAFPPWTIKEADGTWKGFDVDMMNALCERMNAQCRIVPMAWDGMIPALQSNRIDVIWTGMSITEARLKVIDFTDRYRRGPGAFIALKEENIPITDAGLRGKTIGAQGSSNFYSYANSYFGKVAEMKMYATTEEALSDLAARRIDVVLADILQMKLFLNTTAGKDFEIKGQTKVDVAILGRGAGAGIRKGDSALQQRLNTALAAIRADGTYQKIAARYFDFDPYGAD
jgi:polar amino acid transport system substrate-binding protein